MTVPQDVSPVSSVPPVGFVLDGRYRLEARIGGGGMGAVYRGRHLMMDQVVAIKVLWPELARDPATVKRFAREAKSTFRFDHPHCVRVTDFGTSPEGFLYLVMEYLRGRSLSQEISVDGPMAPHRAMHVLRQVCEALGHAHALGFVHRDLKPDNIMLLHRDGDPDFVKVLDFGLAKLLAPEALGTAAISFSPLTGEGTVFGTPAYMSPEQAMGQPLAPSTDIYALGVTLYEMLTGQVPFAGASFMEVAVKHVEEPPVPPRVRRPDLPIPEALDALVMECLAKEPGARPQRTDALAERLAVLVPPRVLPPEDVAASETIDLAASSVDAAQVATAPTLTTSSALPVGPARPPAGRLPTAPAKERAVVARPWPWTRALLLASGMVVAALLGALALGSDTATDAPPPGAAEEPEELPAPAASPALSPPTPAPAPPVPQVLARPHAGEDGSTGTAPTAPAPEPAPGSDETAPAGAGDRLSASASAARRLRARVDRHLAAAEAARRQGNRLKQMAEADSALRIHPDSRQGAFLLGEALLHTGDEATACNYLRRARRLARAREIYRRAGCAGD